MLIFFVLFHFMFVYFEIKQTQLQSDIWCVCSRCWCKNRKSQSWHSSDTKHWIDYFTLLKVQTTCNCSKIPLCSQGFPAPALSAPFVTFPNEREITGEPVKITTCYKALQELEFYYLLSCTVGKFFRSWKYSVLEHQNNLADGWESVVISSVSSDFQRIKLEDKRLLLSSNS